MTGAEIAIVIGGSLVGAFVKSVTGMGYPLVAVPLITLALGIEDAVLIVAVPNLLANLVLWYQSRSGAHETRDLARLVGWGLAGAVVGTFALVSVPEDPLLLALVATIAAFVVNFLRSPEMRIDPARSRRWSPAVGVAAGVAQGAVGVAGPVVATWMHGYRLSKTAYVHSVTAIFGATGAVQIALLAGAGKFTSRISVVSALALVPVLGVIPVGTRLRDRLGGRSFEWAVLAVLVTSGAALVVRVAT